MMKTRQLAATATFAAMLSACAGSNLGGIGDILGGVLNQGGTAQPQPSQAVVEVQSIDNQQQTIYVRTEQGESGSVRFDQNTVVVYQQQQYPVSALERGDIATMQLQQIAQNQLYTPRIDVQQSAQERAGQSPTAGGQLWQLTGRVGPVDHQRGFFELQTSEGSYTVVLPQNAGPATTDYFHRLRSGNTVQIEGTLSGNATIQLYRFV